ncbi:MAG: sensor histidine kinase [Bacteroidetes bacterium]|nr:sensor histidine kinase [Bacteroidota bacterium]
MKNFIKYSLIFCAHFIGVFHVVAQSTEKDSLLTFITTNEKTNIIEALNARIVLASICIKSSDTVLASRLLRESMIISKEKNNYFYLSSTLITWSSYFLSIGNYDASDSCANEALRHLQECSTDDCFYNKVNALSNLSVGKEQKGYIVSSIDLKLKALDIAEKLTHVQKNKTLTLLYSGLASLFANQGQYKKAAYYDNKCVQAQLSLGIRNLNLGDAYVYLADDYMCAGFTDSAAQILHGIKPLVDSLNIPKMYARYYAYSAKLNYLQKNYLQAIDDGVKGRDYALQSRSSKTCMVALLAAGRSYIALQQPQKAMPLLSEDLQIARAVQSLREQSFALKELAIASMQLQKPAEAYEYLLQFEVIKDSIQARNEMIRLNEIETQYQAERRAKAIQLLETEKLLQAASYKQKTTRLYVLVGCLLVVVLIGILVFRNYRQKQIIQTKKIKELEQKKQMDAVSNMILGQETERNRMAKDLHDGIGGMLSGVKLNLSAMKGNMIIHEQAANLFTKSIAQLDSAIREMRRVAHNMMPEALLQLGLAEAIHDYCQGINESKLIEIQFVNLCSNLSLEKSLEIVLYRIVQELTNNAIKHAEAKNLFIQISCNENILNLTIEDDGNGFEVSSFTSLPGNGSGLLNVQSRVDYVKGKMEIVSKPNKGTSVMIEIPINEK